MEGLESLHSSLAPQREALSRNHPTPFLWFLPPVPNSLKELVSENLKCGECGPLVVISSLRIVYEHGYPPRVGAFAFTKESLSSVIRRSFLMDDEYCAVMIQMVLIIKGRCRRRLFNVPSVQTSSPSGEYRIGSHSCLNSKANQSYERALPRVGSHLTR